ncbi:hypothetical protein AHAS_Ahas20G0216500 [Arachis hypogaea]
MATHGRGRTSRWRGNEEGAPIDNQAKFLAAMTNLVHAMQVNPPEFKGSTSFTEFDNWFQAIERALQAQHGNEDGVITWEMFKGELYKKYLSISARGAKGLELLQLKQGFMFIAEYTNKFEELCHFSKICQGAPKDYEEWKCLKYQDGLQDDTRKVLAPLEIKNFAELVNKR